jgi:branched-chain amino acid transport system permease protein
VTAVAQHIIDALSVGSTYALLALGLTLLFGVMGLINFAYGDIIVWCGYGLAVAESAGIGFYYAIPLIIIEATALSVALWYVAFRPFRNAPPITLLLTSFGVALVLESAALLIFGPDPRAFDVPAALGHVWTLGGLRIPVLEVVTIAASAGVVSGLLFMLKRTTLGMDLRATAESRDVAELMGIRPGRVLLAAFAISGLIAGIVAVLELPRLGAVTSNAGLTPTIDAFVAILLGGLGNVVGAVAGGLALGTLETLFGSLLPNQLVAYQEAFVFGFIVLLVNIRPGGLAGTIAEITR